MSDMQTAAITYDQTRLIDGACSCADQTLLCSDVVGFTRMTERLGDERAWSLMEQVNRNIRLIAAQYSGVERELRGDGFLFTFPGAHAGLRAAIAIQRMLRDMAHDPGHEPVALRIALHCGPVCESSDRLFGQHLILAFRLADYAKAEQILVSETARRRLGELWTGGYTRRATVRPAGFSDKVTYSFALWDTETAATSRVDNCVPNLAFPVRALPTPVWWKRQVCKKPSEGERP